MRSSWVLRGGTLAAVVAVATIALATRDACGAAVDAGTYPVPAEIDASGETDVSQALADFIADVPDGGIVRFPPNGRFRVEGTIEVHDAQGLTLDGMGSTLFATDIGAPTRSHLRFVGGTDITVSGIRITGPNKAGGTEAAYDERLQYQHGVDLLGVTGAALSDVTVTEVYGDCFYVGMAVDGSERWSSDVTISDSVCERNGRQGVAVTAGDGVTVEASQFTQVGLTAVDLEPNGTGDGAKDVQIEGNTVAGVRQWFVAIVGRPPVENVAVIGNTLTGMSMSMLVDLEEGARVAGLRIEGNTSDTDERVNRSNAVIDANRVDGLRVTGNTQPLAFGQRLVRAPGSCDVTVADN